MGFWDQVQKAAEMQVYKKEPEGPEELFVQLVRLRKGHLRSEPRSYCPPSMVRVCPSWSERPLGGLALLYP